MASKKIRELEWRRIPELWILRSALSNFRECPGC
jgi:hypothetical protein